MFGSSCLGEFAIAELPVNAPVLIFEGGSSSFANLSSALFDLIEAPVSDIVIVAEISIGTVSDRFA